VPVPAGALDCVIARNTYGMYCVPRATRHRPACRAVLQSRVWEPETLNLMRGVAGDVVHAGTFFGDFLPALATSRAGTVWAFEPNRESYRCAHITVDLNELQNVTLRHGALSGEPGVGSLATTNPAGRLSGGGSRLTVNPLDGVSVEPVPLVTVDEVVPESRDVGLVELDVEGHEQQALLGALRTIERCRPILILESLPAEDWLREHLPDYQVTDVVNGNKVLRQS
jgi:FkbM family methyltransferase